MDKEGFFALAPFAALTVMTLLGMFVRLGKHYLLADIYEAPKWAKGVSLVLIASFWKVCVDLINVKYDFTMGTGFGLLALLGGSLTVLSQFAPERAGE